MSHIAYYRVSTQDQSIEAQRASLLLYLGGVVPDKEFADEGISGSIPARERTGFKALMDYVREGDTVHVNAVDRLGRDAIDVQTIVRDLLDKGVSINVKGLGLIAKGVGELILAVLAQVADMDRNRIRENTAAGRARAIELLATTGRTQHGKKSMGRPSAQAPEVVRQWRVSNRATIAATAQHFGISTATVKRYFAASEGN